MKNVLFATTALVAMTGSAMAASHGGMSPTVSWGGSVTAGYNDVIEGGLFLQGDLAASVKVDLGDSVTAEFAWGGFDWNNNVVTTSDKITATVTYTNGNMTASLKAGDLNDKGASEYFYADRDGMAVDVENQDGASDIRALIEFGNFGVAAGCSAVGGVIGTCEGYNVGLGATFGSIKLGVGYDNASAPQVGVTAVSADATFGSFDIGASYATSTPQNSIGLTAGATFGAVKAKAYYALNSVAADAYGVSVDYDAGAINVHAYYDSAATSTYGVDLGYDLSDALKANVGVYNGGTFVYYAGIDYAVNSNISATLSYATADAISGPEYKDGITALITAEF